jgi:hypothetical protein
LFSQNQDTFQAQSAEIDRRRLAKETTEDLKRFETDLTITTLKKTDDRQQAAKMEYDARVAYYANLYEQGKITEEKLVELNNEALAKKMQAEEKAHLQIMRQMEISAAQGFAQGLTSAIQSWADGTKKAGDAFKDFARNFLSQVANMIIQTEILSAVKAVAGLASGGVVYAAGGLSGVFATNGPTYLPRFNVVAGEAGREMLTVLARPRMMNVGGMEAVVGNAGSNRLAVTNADDLARRGSGAGGHVTIEIAHSEEAKARIVNQAIEGAEVRIVQKAPLTGPLRQALKRAVS